MDTLLPLDRIRIDGGTQMRAQLSESVVEDYSEDVDALPPVTVFNDGTDVWLADGFHRYYAHKKADRDKIRCNVTDGSLRDAILHAVGANSAHGLRRSPADKRRAITALLADKDWSRKSDRWIADKCGVSNHLVADCRAQVGESPTSKRLGKDGKEYSVPLRETPERISTTVFTDEEREAAQRFKTASIDQIEAAYDDKEASEPTAYDPADWDVTPAKVGDTWSIPAALMELRPMVARWARLCPQSQLADYAQMLRDFASQVEEGNWNDS